ncbi:MAG TPA: DUF488 domain-containing protein [bacterium]|nr:DUF488 domain-containing protein [bacterium]
MAGPVIRIKRVYEAPSPDDGTRVLVERLWPRGMSRATLVLDRWMKEVAPSPALRAWYGHEPAKWAAFRRRYIAELNRSGAWRPLLELAGRRPLTLLYSARDPERNSALVLRDYLRQRLRNRRARA